jgi:hypothetical protein
MLLIGKIVLGMTGVGLAGAGMLCSEGFIQMHVNEKAPHGNHINVIVPAMLVPIAMHLAPQRELAQATEEVQPNILVVRAALAALRDADDMVFVEVKEPGTRVHVAKSGGSIVVDVDDADATVYVSAPIRALSSTIEPFAAAPSNAHEWQATSSSQQ